METKNIIQSSANVIRLINLKKGDVFKRVETGSYGGDIFYGVVVDLFNDGKNTSMEVLEYKKNYGDVSATVKVYGGEDDIAIFPATLEEVGEYFNDAIKRVEEDIVKKKDELQKNIISLEKAKEFTKGELSKKLSLTEFKEQSQLEYNEELRLKEIKRKELE